MTSFDACLGVLPEMQRALLPELAFTSKNGFTLYGGTAIALRLGHRTSIDFDFFGAGPIVKDDVYALLNREGVVLQDTPDTVTVNVVRANGVVKISFFGDLVPRRIAGRVGVPQVAAEHPIRVASLEDLLATTLEVVLDRAEAKDYVDIAALLRAGLSLERGLGAARTIFGPAFAPAEALKALVYYGDGDLHTVCSTDRDLLTERAASLGDLQSVPLVATTL